MVYVEINNNIVSNLSRKETWSGVGGGGEKDTLEEDLILITRINELVKSLASPHQVNELTSSQRKSADQPADIVCFLFLSQLSQLTLLRTLLPVLFPPFVHSSIRLSSHVTLTNIC